MKLPSTIGASLKSALEKQMQAMTITETETEAGNFTNKDILVSQIQLEVYFSRIQCF